MKVLITGASGDIGSAIARKFLTCGYEVVGIDVKPTRIEQSGYRHLIASVTEELPEVDNVNVLITAAGVQSEEDAIEINLNGTIRTVEKYAFTPAVRSVLTIASASASNGAEFPLYAASKGGVVTYTKNAALRLAAYGATCNSLSPGGVMTSSNDPVIRNEALFQKALAENLFGRWADPQEIAEWAYFLTVVNKSMTGEDVLVDCGEMLKSNFIWPKDDRIG